MPSERRTEKRRGVDCTVWVRSHGNLFSRARLMDLSSNGAAVAAWDLGPEVDLIFKTPQGNYLTVKAEPCWRREGVIGLRFDRPALQLRRFLGTQVDWTQLAR